MNRPAAEAAAEPAADDARWASRDLWWLAAISAVAAAARLWHIELWSWSDREAETWRALTQPLGAADGGLAGSAEGFYPLLFLFERGLLSSGLLPSFGEGWLRLPYAFVGAVMVPCVAVLARRPFGRGAALLAAVALAVHPAHIAASQTADPAVAAVAVALLVGAVGQRLRSRWAWWMVVVAGLCHPIGWWLGAGALMAMAGQGSRAAALRQRLAALPAWCWWGGVALLLPWGGEAWLTLRGPVVVLGAAACCMLPAVQPVGALLGSTLAIGGALGWLAPGARHAALVAAVPLAVLLAAALAVHLAAVLRRGLPAPPRLGRLVGAVAALVLVGELMTGAFLYFTVQHGGRAPWRDLQRAALSTVRPGVGLQVIAGRGLAPLRVYLRPNHWRGDDYDAHPGTRVEPLAEPAARAAQLAQPDVVLALEQVELDALRADPALAELLARFTEQRVFPCPQPGGDRSLRLLSRPTTQ
ncbi:MAG: hypothetical protein R3F29_15040 [Planctomycetota bacterium]